MTVDRTIKGVGVSPGIALAPAVVLEWRFPEVPDRSVTPDEVETEIRRLHAATATVAAHLNMLRERVLQSAGLEESQIFEAQIFRVILKVEPTSVMLEAKFSTNRRLLTMKNLLLSAKSIKIPSAFTSALSRCHRGSVSPASCGNSIYKE